MSVEARETSDGGRSSGEAPAPRTTSPAGRGFAAHLRGVGLWDLVQMECLGRSRVVVQVASDGGGVGYLYFDAGHIVHATTALGSGEAAALEILSWPNGSFQGCDRPWPERPTIVTPHEALILEAVRRQDERRASNLVAFPARMPNEREERMRSTNISESLPTTGGHSEASGDFSVVLRLGENGTVISNRGGTDDFSETIAYVHRLVELAGNLLGLEPFSALECSFLEGRCLIFAEGEGDVVALRPRPEAALGALRERLGL